jgi:hypothetical protein
MTLGLWLMVTNIKDIIYWHIISTLELFCPNYTWTSRQSEVSLCYDAKYIHKDVEKCFGVLQA